MIYLLKILELFGLRKPSINVQAFHFAILDEDQIEKAIKSILDEREKLIRLVKVLLVTVFILIAGMFLVYKMGYDSNTTIWIPPTEIIGS